jgi:hypothetical protein
MLISVLFVTLARNSVGGQRPMKVSGLWMQFPPFLLNNIFDRDRLECLCGMITIWESGNSQSILCFEAQ